MQEEGAPERGLEGLIDEALDSKEPIKKPQAEKLRPQGLLERIILSKWTPVVYTAAVAALSAPIIILPESLSLSDRAVMAIGALVPSFYAVKFAEEDWLIRKEEATRRKPASAISKIANAILSHPEIVAIPAAAIGPAIYLGQPLSNALYPELFKHPSVFLLPLSMTANLALVTLNSVYVASSFFLGRVPEAIKAVAKALSATRKARKAMYTEAAKDLAELLETPKPYSVAVALQTAIGDMKMLSDNPPAIDTYISALATQKTPYRGRSEDILHPFLRAINRIADKAKKPAWAAAEDVQSVIWAAKELSRGKLNEADKILLSAVSKHRKSLTAHMARASFLRATGQHQTADLEMKVCAELVMQDPNAKLEPVEGRNRNVVYFSGNVAMKQNENPEALEGERSIVEMFRKRFDSSVIYPLPVYKRGKFYTLLSEKAVSETLFDLIKQKRARLEDFVQADELMVQMQHFGLERYRAGELKLNDAIRDIKQSDRRTLIFAQRRLQAIENTEQFNGVKMPQSYKDALGFGLSFVDVEMAESELLTMCKDYAPKNILKRLFGLMQVLDFEPQSLRLLPPQMDFINLTESLLYLSMEQLLWLQNIHFELQQKVTQIRIPWERFYRTHTFSGFQWHYERLIYSTREAYQAKTQEEREEKKKDQVWHLVRTREYFAGLIEKNYVSGEQLQAALRAIEELARPIFPDPEEQRRLERIVEEERKKPLEQEPSPAGAGRIAAALVGVPTILLASVVGAAVARNNFIPIIDTPIIRQSEKILLAAQEAKGIGYYVIDTKTDQVSFLTHADDSNASMSKFSDKAVFLKEGKVTLYNFIKKEFRTAQNAGLANPVISPNGTWIAAEIEGSDAQPYTSRLRRIRPSDMKDFTLVNMQNDFIRNPRPVWSPDSRYLLFFLASDPPEQNKSWAGIYILDLLEFKLYEGPAVSATGKHVAALSINDMLAYSEGDGVEVYLSGPNLKNPRKVYEVGRRDMLGYENETVEDIKFVSDTHLAIISALSGGAQQGVKRVVSLLDLVTKRIVTFNGSKLLDASNSGKVLYICNEPSDLCEFDTNTAINRNMTASPGLSEILAVYAQGGKKIYAISYPAGCGQEMCMPSLFVIDPVNGTSKLLKQSETAGSYSLIAPPP